MNKESTGLSEPMRIGTAPHQTRHEQSQDKSVRAEGGGLAAGGGHAEIHDRTGLYLSVIALILSALALGAAFMFPQFIDAKMDALNKRTEIAEREARLVQEDLMYLRASMAARGIPVHHFDEEEQKRVPHGDH